MALSRYTFLFTVIALLITPLMAADETGSGENLTPGNFLRPDLVVGDIEVPDSAVMGFPAAGTVSIRNIGPQAAPGVRIEFQLVGAEMASPAIWLHEKTTREIPGLYQDTVPYEVTIPDGIEEGEYLLAVSISTTGVETNLTNNQGISGVPIRIGKSTPKTDRDKADLSVIIDSVSGLNFTPGYPYSLNYTVQNKGSGNAGTFYVGFFLSDDPEIEPSDIKVADEIYYRAGLGMNETGISADLLSTGILPGSYHLGAIIDFTSKVNESDEENNRYLYPEMVTVREPVTVVTDQTLNEIAGFIALKTNSYREYKGLSPLVYDLSLGRVSSAHSQDMAVRSFFSHINPDGLDPTGRARLAGYETSKRLGDGQVRTGIAENIMKISPGYTIGKAYSGFVDPTSPEEVADLMMIEWIDSPEHQVNLVNPTVTNLGVGVAYDGEFFYATQNFY